MNIFIANLNYRIQDDGLRSLFEDYGEVSSAKIIMDRNTGRSRGFGFVEMPADQEAESAINGLNGSEVDGRSIVVRKAKPRSQ